MGRMKSEASAAVMRAALALGIVALVLAVALVACVAGPS
jgi:hypothetical protein